MAVDETLTATKCHIPMLQYIPLKATKFGVKFLVLTESLTGDIQYINCYLGRVYEPTPTGTLQGTQVVMNILFDSNLLNKAYHECVIPFLFVRSCTKIIGSIISLTRLIAFVVVTLSLAPINALFFYENKRWIHGCLKCNFKRSVLITSLLRIIRNFN